VTDTTTLGLRRRNWRIGRPDVQRPPRKDSLHCRRSPHERRFAQRQSVPRAEAAAMTALYRSAWLLRSGRVGCRTMTGGERLWTSRGGRSPHRGVGKVSARGDGPAAGERPLGRPSDGRPAGSAYRGSSGAFRFLTRGSGPASGSLSRTIMADYAVEGTPSADLGWGKSVGFTGIQVGGRFPAGNVDSVICVICATG
jgi:hypothetical protein